MAIDHTSVTVPKDRFKECLAVYLAALEPLGYELRQKFGETVVDMGSGSDASVLDYKRSDFWTVGVDGSSTFPIHIAFTAAGKSGPFSSPSRTDDGPRPQDGRRLPRRRHQGRGQV